WFANGRTDRSRPTPAPNVNRRNLRGAISRVLAVPARTNAEQDTHDEASGGAERPTDQLPANQAADRKVDHLGNLHHRLNLRAAWYPARRRVPGERRRHDDGRDRRADDRAYEHENDRVLHTYGCGIAVSTTCCRLKPAGFCRIGNSLKLSS